MKVSILDDAIASFEKEHQCHIRTELVKTNTPSQFFAMSIIPEKGIMRQMIDAINKKQAGKCIPLWKKCKNWILEVDSQVIRLLTDQELTALAYHELGHYIDDTSIPNQIIQSIQYYTAVSSIGQRALILSDRMKELLRIPFITNCRIGKSMAEMKKNMKQELAMRKEYKADSYAARNGYYEDLMSAMSKIAMQFENGNAWGRDDVKAAYAYTTKTLENLRKRQLHLIHSQAKGIKKYLPQSELSKAVDELDIEFASIKNLEEEASNIYKKAFEDEFFTETALFKKRVNLVTQNQLDYIGEQIPQMRTETDRMMLLSYVNGKLEGVEWAIAAYTDPKTLKKYIIEPLDVLQRNRKILEGYRERIINGKLIPKSYELILPEYPDGYEG